MIIMNNLFNWILETLGFHQLTERPDPSDPCNAGDCIDAKKRLTGERSSFVRICLRAQALKAILDFLSIITATPIWVIVVLIAMAIFFGLFFPPIAILIWAAIAGWALAFYFKVVLNRVFGKVIEALKVQQTRVEEAILTVMRNCPEPCREDVSMPECELN
jgi:small-conductance mechanosensitive channel